MRAIFLTVVGPTTYRVLRDLLSPALPTSKTLEQLLEILSNHFDPAPSEIVERYKFNSRVRHAGESVTKYIAELQRMATFCNYGAFLDEMLRDRIVCGIQDKAIQRKLLAETSLTLARATEIAVSMEAAAPDTADLRTATTPSVHKIQAKKTTGTKRKNGKQVVTPSSRKKCFRCGNANHESSGCRYKNTTTNYEWDEYWEPIEIKNRGKYVLSDTEKGKSIIFFDPKFYEEDKASELMDHLLNATNWQAKNVTIRGIEYPQPRLVAWYGPFPYSYSGVTLEPDIGMPYCVFEIKKKVEKYLKVNGVNVRFNSVLLNRYRSNKDSVSWHSDDETSMGIDPTIASVSLGDTRRFEMRRRLKYFEGETSYTETDEYFIRLNNGSFLLMDGSMQKDWQHRVPKEHEPRQERINLTFRTVYKVESLLHSPKAQIKRSLDSVTKIHRKKISFGKTVDTDAESECSFTESNKPEKKNLKSPLKVEDQICGDAETKRSLEQVTKTHREKKLFEKTLGTDAKSKGSDTICKTEDFETVIESKKPEEKNPKSSFKVEDKVCGDIKTNACNHLTSKTEEKLNESDEEDIIELSYKKRTKLDVKIGVKNIDDRNATTGKNKRLCVSTQSITTHSLSNTVQNDFKVKNENMCNADNRYTLSESRENDKFDSCELKDLLECTVDLMDSKSFRNYANALKIKVLQNINGFRLPAKAELEVLCELMHGNQSEGNQKVIIRRMLTVVGRALKLSQGSSKPC